MEKILEVHNLHVSFNTFAGKVKAVRGVDLHLKKGETLAIVGESGSGKSVTAKSIMRLIPSLTGKIEKGKINFLGKDIAQFSEKDMQTIRGSEIAMIFQDPMTALNPTMKIGKQITEAITKMQRMEKKQLRNRAIQLLKLVGIPNPEVRLTQYPHQFSGGMRQRVVIAIALAGNPKIIIADEPTTALDVTTQAQILELMKLLQAKMETAIVIITHDLGVVANIANRVAVMYAGKIVETGAVDEIFYKPKHPYTWGLLASMPKLGTKKGQLLAIPGTPPDLLSPPLGCSFAARCPYVMAVCIAHMPKCIKSSATHYVACWLQDARAAKVEPPPEAVGGSNRG